MAKPIVLRFEGESHELEQTIDTLEGRLGGLGQVAGGVALGNIAADVAGEIVSGFGDAFGRDTILDQMNAKLGALGPEAERFGDIAGSLYAGAWGDSLEEVAEAVAKTQTALGDIIPEGELEDATSRALDLAKVMDEDLGRVTQTVGQLLRNNLAGSAEEAFDILAAGQQNGLNRTEDLLDTLNEYSASFGRLGIDGESALNLLNQGLDEGVFNTDKIGDAFNEFSIRAIDGSTATTDALKALGIDQAAFASEVAAGGEEALGATSRALEALGAMEDQVAQDAAGVALFGSMWEDLGAEAILALDPTAKALDNVDGSAAVLSDTLNDNLGTKLESLKRQGLEAVAGFIEDNVIPVVEEFADWAGEKLPPALQAIGDTIERRVVPVIETLVDWVKTHINPTLSELIGWLGENEQILEAVGIAIGILMGGAFVVFVAGLVAAAAPVVALVAALAGLVLGVQWAYENIEWFSDLVDGVVEFFRSDFVPLMEGIADFFQNKFAPFIADSAETLAGFATTVGEVAAAVIEFLQPMIDLFERKFRRLIEIGQEVIDFFKAVFTGDWQAALDAIKNIAGTVVEDIKDTIGTITEFLLGLVPDLLDAAGDVGKSIIDGILDGITGTVSFVADFAKGVGNAIIDLINTQIIGRINDAIPNKIEIKFAPDIDLPDNPLPTIPRLFSGGPFPGLALVGDHPLHPTLGEVFDGRQGGGTIFNRHESRHRAPSTAPMIGTLVVHNGDPAEIVAALRFARRRHPL